MTMYVQHQKARGAEKLIPLSGLLSTSVPREAHLACLPSAPRQKVRRQPPGLLR